MNFAFSAEQRLLGSTAKKLLEQRASMDVVRAASERRPAHDSALWHLFASVGWQATAIPEEYGGAGFGYLELAVLAEQLGASLAPTAFSSSIYLAAEAILRGGSPEQRKQWLPGLADGSRIATFAHWDGEDPVTVVEGGALTGSKVSVADAEVADIAVCSAQHAGGLSLFVVNLRAEGVSILPLKGLDDTRSYARISFNNVRAELLDHGDVLDEVLDRAAVLFAFEQLGGAQRCLEAATRYAAHRSQFGRPIGSFQAIKHRLADMLVEVELARSNCYYAAWAAESGPEALPVAACLARVSASRAYQFAAQEGLHIHGGLGFTWEADPHLYLKRAKTLELNLGGPSHWRELLMTRQGY